MSMRLALIILISSACFVTSPQVLAQEDAQPGLFPTCDAPVMTNETSLLPSISDRQFRQVSAAEKMAIFVKITVVGYGRRAKSVGQKQGSVLLTHADLASGGEFVKSNQHEVKLAPISETVASGWAVILAYPSTTFFYVHSGVNVGGWPGSSTQVVEIQPERFQPAIYAGEVVLCANIKRGIFSWGFDNAWIEEFRSSPEEDLRLIHDSNMELSDIEVVGAKFQSARRVFRTEK